MSKIAYLIGIPGAGKSHVANSLKDELGDVLDVITGDDLLHWAVVRLCPYIKPGHDWDWELWAAMTRNCDLRSALRRTILDMANCGLLPIPAPGKLFLAEATLFGLSRLRQEFQVALNEAGFAATKSMVFWLDPSAADVLGRVRQRGRRNEHFIDDSEVDKRQRQYADADPGADFRSGEADATASAIRRFLLGAPE